MGEESDGDFRQIVTLSRLTSINLRRRSDQTQVSHQSSFALLPGFRTSLLFNYLSHTPFFAAFWQFFGAPFSRFSSNSSSSFSLNFSSGPSSDSC